MRLREQLVRAVICLALYTLNVVIVADATRQFFLNTDNVTTQYLVDTVPDGGSPYAERYEVMILRTRDTVEIYGPPDRGSDWVCGAWYAVDDEGNLTECGEFPCGVLRFTRFDADDDLDVDLEDFARFANAFTGPT